MNYDQLRWEARAWLMEMLGNKTAAIEAYERAYAAAPAKLRLAHIVGFMYAQQNDFDKAEAWLLRVCEREPNNGEAWFNLGFVRDKAHRWQNAIDAFGRAVELVPNQDRAWYGMGMAQAHLGRHDEAAKALEEAARLQPMNGHAWYALGMAYHHLHDPDQVKRAAEQLAQFDPQRAKIFIRETERPDLHYLVEHLG